MKQRRATARAGPRAALDAKAARMAAADLLSRRAWTGADLDARLRRRGAPPDVAADVVGDMERRGYIDDAAFARRWVEARAVRGYGAARLRAELRARGVAVPHIDAALAAMDSEASLERARALARQRLAVLRRTAPAQRVDVTAPRGTTRAGRADPSGRTAARLRDYLLRRGLARGVAMRVVREVTGEADIADG